MLVAGFASDWEDERSQLTSLTSRPIEQFFDGFGDRA
jgi:hypothetical protein